MMKVPGIRHTWSPSHSISEKPKQPIVYARRTQISQTLCPKNTEQPRYFRVVWVFRSFSGFREYSGCLGVRVVRVFRYLLFHYLGFPKFLGLFRFTDSSRLIIMKKLKDTGKVFFQTHIVMITCSLHLRLSIMVSGKTSY